ncbi:MAG TPA: DNA double-strand break repair nuclease NurA [Anaerolineae bacterium]|nr:DNA double-strand break repair nuclease NurA [Anaerolineae bacterium]
MTLEYERILPKVKDLVATAVNRQRQLDSRQKEIAQKLTDYATDRDAIARAIQTAQEKTGGKLYAAEPHPAYAHEPLNAGVTAVNLPETAVIIGGDGSQVLPDRHAPYLYYLINIGVIVYYHGRNRAPDVFTRPILEYPGLDWQADEGKFTSANVAIQRDLAEIGVLAATACEQAAQTDDPVLALLDQRLLYWPIGGDNGRSDQKTVYEWIKAMRQVEACHRERGTAYLTGYTSEPGTGAVVNMLRSLNIGRVDTETGEIFNPEVLKKRSTGLVDASLFAAVLQPDERSTVFVNISENNKTFQAQGQEVCFFYLHPGDGKHIARVDIPRWVADDPAVVDQIHALIVDQCKMAYPYVLTRADEIAVILSQDRDYLEKMIAVGMGPEFALRRSSPKQSGKDVTRSGTARFGE